MSNKKLKKIIKSARKAEYKARKHRSRHEGSKWMMVDGMWKKEKQ